MTWIKIEQKDSEIKLINLDEIRFITSVKNSDDVKMRIVHFVFKGTEREMRFILDEKEYSRVISALTGDVVKSTIEGR